MHPELLARRFILKLCKEPLCFSLNKISRSTSHLRPWVLDVLRKLQIWLATRVKQQNNSLIDYFCLLEPQAGTKRDKATLDASTDRIKSLLFKVNLTLSCICSWWALFSPPPDVNFSSLMYGQVRSVRMSGSCALNLCGIACGRLDLFYETGFGGPWYGFMA